jgi:hypothetical protein
MGRFSSPSSSWTASSVEKAQHSENAESSGEVHRTTHVNGKKEGKIAEGLR